MIYGYIRVSTDTQDSENQKIGIIELAKRHGNTIDKWIADDGISGAVDYKKRHLGQLMGLLKDGDTIYASEISRFARNMYMLFEILKFLTENQIKMYTVKDGYTLDGTIQSKVLAFGLGLAAEIERDMISKRTKEGLEARRKAGIVLGRPIGAKSGKTKLTGKEEQITELLKSGIGYSGIARILKCHRLTVSEFCVSSGISLHKILNNNKGKEVQEIPELKKLSMQKNVSQKEILIDMYVNNYFSFEKISKILKVSQSRVVNNAKFFGIFDELKLACENQRKKVKSLKQIERETGIVRRKH